MNILREDWKPVLSLHSVLVGLQYLFLEPNADDPLNKGKEHRALREKKGKREEHGGRYYKEWSSHLSSSIFCRSGRRFATQQGWVREQCETFTCRRYSKGGKIRQCFGIRLPPSKKKKSNKAAQSCQDREKERKTWNTFGAFNENRVKWMLGCTNQTNMEACLAIRILNLSVTQSTFFLPFCCCYIFSLSLSIYPTGTPIHIIPW